MSETKGLHLWNVTVSSAINKQGLLVTTSRHDIAGAIKKAGTVMRDTSWEFHNQHNKITDVEFQGTIDV